MARRVAPLSPNDGHYIHDTRAGPGYYGDGRGSPEVLGTKVEDIMSPNPLTMLPNTPVFEAASKMDLKNMRCMPVMEKHRLVDMVDIGDLNRGLFFEHGM